RPSIASPALPPTSSASSPAPSRRAAGSTRRTSRTCASSPRRRTRKGAWRACGPCSPRRLGWGCSSASRSGGSSDGSSKAIA
ncbi:MAG: hypothetical protein AVDCRST_MAG17-260, partial [uncultured Solirubrobacterales bacterium]